METRALVFPDQGRGFTRGVSERAPSLRSVDGFVRTPNVCFSFQFLRRAWNPAIVVDCAKFKNPDPRHRQNKGRLLRETRYVFTMLLPVMLELCRLRLLSGLW